MPYPFKKFSFCLTAASLCLATAMTQAQAQEVNFGQPAPQPQANAQNAQAQQAANPNAPPAPEPGYSQYAPAPGVWQENEDLPPPGVDAPPVQPAPNNPGSDTATPVGNESQAPTDGVPDPNADPNAENGGLMSAAAEPAAVSGVGSDHPGMNGP